MHSKTTITQFPTRPLLLALLAAVILKIGLVASGALPFNADEAVVSLMARHILQGERPVFFYGQAYMGSLDAWLVAGGFSLFGQQVWVIRAVQSCLYLLILATTAWLGKAVFSSWKAGTVGAWLLAVPSVTVTLYTTVSLGGYAEALLIGNLICIITLGISKNLTKNRCVPYWSWLVWGFLAGLGIWVFGITLVYTVPAGLLLAWRLWKNSPRPSMPSPLPSTAEGLGVRAVLFACFGALLGSSPLWGYALQHGINQMIRELVGGAIAGTDGLGAFSRIVQHLFSLVVLAGTSIFSLRPSWEVRWLGLPLLPFVLAFWLGCIIYIFRQIFKVDTRTDGQLLLCGVMLAVGLGFILTPFGGDPSGRYFLPAAVPLALFAASMILDLLNRTGPLAWSLVGLVLIYNLWGTVDCIRRYPPGLTTQFDPVTQIDPRAGQDLVAFLRERHLTRGYTNYWVAYPMAFLSQEELIYSPRLPYHPDFRYTGRDDRYPPYTEQVGQAEQVAYITTRSPALDETLRSGFRAAGIAWREAQIGDYRVFYELSRRINPEEIGLAEKRGN